MGGSEKSRLLGGSELCRKWSRRRHRHCSITVCLNTSFETCSPLVSGIVHHALLELTLRDLRLNQLLSQLVFLHFTRQA